MGCDIHCHTERRKADGTWEYIAGLHPFEVPRYYPIFAFLADEVNVDGVLPISERRGLPEDVTHEVMSDYKEWDEPYGRTSWLFITELTAFDYDIAGDFDPPQQLTYRQYLGREFFTDLEALCRAKAERIVFWFDN